MEGHMAVIPMERIERAILSIRGEKVMLDSDLAELYGVETKVLNTRTFESINKHIQSETLLCWTVQPRQQP